MEKILVTGATGNIGLALLRVLENDPQWSGRVVAAVRDVEYARKVAGDLRCEFVKFEFDESASYPKALEGVKKLVLIRPYHLSDVTKYIFPFLDYAEKSGVEQIVFVSIVGAEKNRVFANHRIETHLRKMKVEYTILRSSLFMQNLTTMHLGEIRDNNRLFVPAGHGLVNYIDVRDVAELIAHVASTPGFGNREFEITGPEAFNFYQIAGMLSEVTGREIKYAHPLTIQFIRQKLKRKSDLPMVVTLSLLYGAARNGKMSATNGVFTELTGKEPRRLKAFIEEHKSVWTK